MYQVLRAAGMPKKCAGLKDNEMQSRRRAAAAANRPIQHLTLQCNCNIERVGPLGPLDWCSIDRHCFTPRSKPNGWRWKDYFCRLLLAIMIRFIRFIHSIRFNNGNYPSLKPPTWRAQGSRVRPIFGRSFAVVALCSFLTTDLVRHKVVTPALDHIHSN